MPDTLSIVKDAVVNQGVDTLELLTNVQGFYENAWTKLLVVGSLAVGVVGIVMPLIIQWYQKKIITASEDRMEGIIKEEIKNAKQKLKQDLDEEFAKFKKELEVQIDSVREGAIGNVFHLQANSNCEAKHYASALQDYLKAALSYQCDNSNMMDLQLVIKAATLRCLPNLHKDDLAEIELKQKNSITEILDKLEKKDETNAIALLLQDCRIAVNNAQKRSKK